MVPAYPPAPAIRRKGFVSRLALALALAAGGLAGSVVLAAPAQAQSENPVYSKKFGKSAQPVAEALNAARSRPDVDAEVNNLIAANHKMAAAKPEQMSAAIAEFNAVSMRLRALTLAERATLDSLAASATTPDDKFKVGEYQVFLGSFTGDIDLQATGLRTEIQSGVLKPELLISTWFSIGKLYFDYQRYADAIPAFTAAYQAGDDNSALYVLESYTSSNRLIEGLDYFRDVITARAAAGRPVELGWVGTGLNRANQSGDLERTSYWAALYAKTDNSPESWNVAIAVTIDGKRFDLQENLDLLRLMGRSGSLVKAKDYLDYIQAAMGRAGVAYPGEVVKISEQAIASGKVPADDEFLSQALGQARNLLADDKKSLPGLEKDGRASATGSDALAAGDAFLSYDMAAKAEELYRIALEKGGIDQGTALTRMAIAQVDQGNYAGARENLAKVSGNRKPIADLWLAWLDVKSASGG